MKSIGWAALLCILPFTTNAAQFRGIGTNVIANAVSGNGRVVVGSLSNAVNHTDPFRWNCGQATIYPIPQQSLYPNPSGMFFGVSGDGQFMAGKFIDGRDQAFLWNFDSRFQYLAFKAVASDVSDQGTAVGVQIGLLYGTAMRWPGGSIHTNSFNGSSASAITPDGQVIVGTATAQPRSQPFKWTQQDGMVGLTNIAGFDCYGTGVSAEGNVVVGYGLAAYTNGIYQRIVFRWTKVEGMAALGPPLFTFYNDPAFQGTAVNGDGTIIVGTITPSTNSPSEAFIWDPTNGLRNLKSVLEATGIDLTGWSLNSAVDISTNGQVIVGNGTNANGEAEAWIAVLEDSFPSFDSCPNIPVGLSGSFISSSQLSISWNPSANATGYKLQRKEGTNGIWAIIGLLSQNATNYIDSFAPGYRAYRVLATNDIDYSLYSEPLEISTGTFSFSTTSYTVGENDSFVTINVVRSGGSAGTATVNFATVYGTAVAGEDYISTNGVLVFTNGQISKAFSVRILPDSVVDPNETFSVNLSDPSVGTMLAASTATVTIIDSPPEQFSLKTSNISVLEGNTNILINVIRNNGTTGNATVNFATIDGTATAGSDYVATNGVLSFAEGETNKTFVIQILDDVVLESSEAFNIELSDAVGAVLAAPTNAVIVIADDEVVLGFALSEYDVSESSTSAIVSVNRTGPMNKTVSIDFAVMDETATGGADYLETHGTLIFQPGDATKAFTVPIISDGVTEGSETARLVLFNSSTNAILGISNATLRISDVVTPGEFDFSVSSVSAAESDGDVFVTITRQNGSAGAASVKVSVLNGTADAGLDYVSTNLVVSFADGEFSKTIPILILNDSVAEQTESFAVRLSDAIGATLGAVTNMVISITDDGDSQPVLNAILFQNGGRLAQWQMAQTNFLGVQMFFKQASSGWQITGLADFGNDGKSDFLWRNTNGTIAVWFMDGTNFLGGASLRNGLRVPTDWKVVGVLDLNADGKADILWQNLNGRLAAWLMDGTNFHSPTSVCSGHVPSALWHVVGTSDFNDDQQQDLLFQHEDGRLAIWYLNQTNFVRMASVRNGRGSANGWRLVGLNDFNGDNQKDFLFQSVDDRLGVWFMNQGTNFLGAVPLRNGQPAGTGWRVVGTYPFAR